MFNRSFRFILIIALMLTITIVVAFIVEKEINSENKTLSSVNEPSGGLQREALNKKSSLPEIGLEDLMPYGIKKQKGPDQTLAKTFSGGTFENMLSGPLSVSFVPESGIFPEGEMFHSKLNIRINTDVSGLKIFLSTEGIVKYAGDTYFEYNQMKKDAQITIPLNLSVTGDGKGVIFANVRGNEENSAQYINNTDNLYFLTSESGILYGTTGYEMLELKKLDIDMGNGRINKTQYETGVDMILGGGQKKSSSQGSGNEFIRNNQSISSSSNYFVVSGLVQWLDEAKNPRSVRFAPVEIWDLETGSIIDTVQTNMDGEYNSIPIYNDNGRIIYIEVLAKSDGFEIGPEGIPGVYSLKSYIREVTTDEEYVVIPVVNYFRSGPFEDHNIKLINKAFSIHDALIYASEYVKGMNTRPPPIRINFPTSDTSFYWNPISISINEKYAYKWDAIHHEYGHYIGMIKGISSRPLVNYEHTGYENLGDKYGKNQGIILAWAEGWANYFAISMQNEMGTFNVFPDAGDLSVLNIFNIESGDSLGEDNEISVSRILWDLYDTGNDRGDIISLGDHTVWNVVIGARATTLDAAWDAFSNEPLSMQYIVNLGDIFTENSVAPFPLKPPYIGNARAEPPVFEWTNNGGGNLHRNNKFIVEIWNTDFTNRLFESPEIDSNGPDEESKYDKLSQKDWDDIKKKGVSPVKWFVRARQTDFPETGSYVSTANTLIITPFEVTVDPKFGILAKGESKTYKINVKNIGLPVDKAITLHTSDAFSGWSVDDSQIKGRKLNLRPGSSVEFTLIVKNEEATKALTTNIWGEVEGEKSETEIYNGLAGRGHGDDHPDDSYIISNSGYPTSWNIDTESEVGILLNGWGEGIGHLLGRYNVSTAPVKPDMTIAGEPYRDIYDLSVLIIGSAGLSGLDNSPTFKNKLAEFVENGGTLISLTGQQGYEFNALPGGEVSGYGWNEDQSCQFQSTGIATYHPMLSGQNSATPSINVDGYFTKYPKNSTVLLTRTKNGMPAMLMYNYGRGKVIATTMYDDWAYGSSSATSDGLILIRDIVAWAKDPKNITTFAAGDIINSSINVTNYGSSAAEKISFAVFDPDRKIDGYVNASIPILPGETKEVNFNYIAPSTPGIWFVEYSLIDINGTKIQEVHEAERFAISKFKDNPGGFIKSGSQISFDITSDAEQYSYGSAAFFTFHIRNKGSTDKNIRVGWGLIHHERAGIVPSILSNTIYVPANQDVAFTYKLPRVVDLDRLRASFFDEEGYSIDDGHIGDAERGFWMFMPALDINISTEMQKYAEGENVTLNIHLDNRQSADQNSAIKVRVFDPENTGVFEETFEANISSNSSVNRTLFFTIPHLFEKGAYIVSAEAFDNYTKLGYGSAYFSVPSVHLKMNIEKPLMITPGGNNTFIFNITKINRDSFNGWLNFTLLNDSGNTIFNSSTNISSNSSDQSVVYSVDVQINESNFGKYVLNYSLIQGEQVISGEMLLPNSDIIKLDFDKPSYHTREDLSAAIWIINNGIFFQDLSMNISVPDINFSNTTMFKLKPGEKHLDYLNLSLPDNLIPGNYGVNVTLSINNTFSKNFMFHIPESNLRSSFGSLNLSAGENLTFNIENTGGVDTTVNYTLVVNGFGFNNVTHGNFNVPINTPITEYLPLKSGLKEGEYFARLTYTDLGTGIMGYTGKLVNIKGVIGKVNVSTGRKAYLTDNIIEVLSHLTSTSGVNGTLNLKIYRTSSSLENSYSPLKMYDLIDKRIMLSDASRTLRIVSGPMQNLSGQKEVDMQLITDPIISLSSNVIIVAQDGTGNFTGIQDAINASNDGDTILVYSGTYYENVNVSKSLVLRGIETVSGYPPLVTVENGNAITLCANQSTIEGFDVMTNKKGSAGILITSNDNVIKNNFASNNLDVGILLKSSMNNSLIGNTVLNNYYGITLWNSSNNTLRMNEVSNNNEGISLYKKFSYIDLGSSNNNILSGNTISNNREGIYLDYSFNNILNGNNISNNIDGIFLWYSGNNTLTSNYVMNNRDGIFLDYSGINTLSFNDVNNNDWEGIYLSYSSNNIITNNNANFNVGTGIVVYSSNYNTLSDNNANSNYVGIFIMQGSHNTVIKSNIAYSNQKGILFYDSRNGTLSSNDVSNNIYGMDIGNSIDGTIEHNIVLNNSNTGISIYGINNTIYDNYFENKYNAKIQGTQTNYWNKTLTPGRNIIGGPYIGGNYWSDYNGTDSNGDGIGEIPYLIPGDQIDYYPLTDNLSQKSSGDIIWEKNIPVDIPPDGSSIPVSVNISSDLNKTTGRLILAAELISNSSQVLGTSNLTFYVFDTTTTLALETDKEVYKPGEPVIISGEVRNWANASTADMNFVLLGSDTELWNETFSLNADEARIFSAIYSSNASFTINASFGSIQISQPVIIEAPSLIVNITAPLIAGRQGFNVSTLIENPGKLALNENLDVEGMIYHLNIPGKGSRLIETPFIMNRNMTLNITLRGDVDLTFRRSIVFGENASLKIFPEMVYPPGMVEIPYTISNTGYLENAFTAVFDIGNERIDKVLDLPPRGSFSGSLVFDLPEGSYSLNYSTPFESGKKDFRVIGMDIAKMNVTIPQKANNGIIKITVNVSNSGANTFIGNVEVDTGFYSNMTPVEIGFGDSRNMSFDVPVKIQGDFNGTVRLLHNGEILDETTGNFSAYPEFTITNAPDNQVFLPGEKVNMNFSVLNTGGMEGKAGFNLIIPGIYENTNDSWIAPGEGMNLSFSFIIPDDLEEKNYKMFYGFKDQMQEDRFFVKGPNISVEASLDKYQYREGEKAILTMHVKNNGGFNLPLFSRVKFNEYENVTYFNLSGAVNQTLSFEVPIHFSGDKIFYSVYMATGRSLYINSLYVYEKQRADSGIILYTDRQVYRTGETVNVYVSVSKDGMLNFIAPGFNTERSLTAGDSTVIIFILPELSSGTYSIDYTFDNYSSSYPLDVNGYSTKILGFTMDKEVYDIGDRMKMNMLVEANRDFSGVVKFQIYGQGIEDTFEFNRNFAKGENRIDINRTLVTNWSGIHSIVYTIYSDLIGDSSLLLSSGEQYFEVIDHVPPLIKIISPAKNEYDSGSLDLIFTIEDTSDLKWTGYSLDGANNITSAGSTILTGLTNRNHTIIVYSMDSAGNMGFASVEFKVNAGPDLTPSNTTIILYGTPGNNGWYISDVLVNLIAEDNTGGSGINKTEYSFDNSNWIKYNNMFLITNEDMTTIYYRSTDNSGNVESTRNQTIKIDKTPPASIINLQATAGSANINLSWINPSDPDISHVMLYLNGTFITDVPAQQDFYNLSGMQLDTTYELGTHTVDIAGNINDTWINASVRTLPSAEVPPVADCGVDKLRCENIGAKVQFNATGSYDLDGTILSYVWEFGDETNGTGIIPDHTYSKYNWNGTAYEPFIVNLTVTDYNGLTNRTSQNVIIWMAGDANGDGIVNILDASVVGLKWGTNDPCADLNNDDVVNILDASLIGLNWGKSARVQLFGS